MSGPVDYTSPNSVAVSWKETALDWSQRSRLKRAIKEIPRNPSDAARSFVQPISEMGGTGISFLDEALRTQVPGKLPVIDVRGEHHCGKTWTIISLAARFVVATRPSQFSRSGGATTNYGDYEDETDRSPPPQVLILDSCYGVTVAKLTHVVQSNLLRHSTEKEMASCLERIHLASVNEASDWVAILECIKYELATVSHPTLVLWDGFLSEPTDDANRMEVIRQVVRLLEECKNVLFISTTCTTDFRKLREWEKYISHRIRLERLAPQKQQIQQNPLSKNMGHEYVATFQGSQHNFSISLTGILD